MTNTHEKLIVSIDTMISDAILRLQFYGEFCQFINFTEAHNIQTCGVTVEIGGMRFIFNRDFLDNLPQEEVNFIVLHEIMHLLWDHQARTRKLGYERALSNVAQDMIINNVIKTDIIDKMLYYNKKENRNMSFAKIPSTQEGDIWVLELPEEYKGNLVFEELYEWLLEQRNKYDQWKKDIKSSEIDESSSCPISPYLQKIFDDMSMGIEDFLDKHLSHDLPEEYRKSIIEDVKNALKNRGLITGDIQSTLDKITKSKKDYIKGIKVGINELFGNYKNKSITKRNRRNINGIKGKRKESYALNVLLDVSGSMEGYFEKALSYIFQNGIVINLIQCDTEVKDYVVIKNKFEFKKIKITGLGGTALQPGIDFISQNKKINDLNVLILTDGLVEKLNVTKLKKCMVISHLKKCDIIGKAKQIIIEK